MSSAPGKVGVEDLREFAQAILQAAGFSSDHAGQTADLLVWANLRGVDSHGVLRIPRYIEMVGLGMIDAGAKPTFEREFGATAVLNAGRAPGPVGMNMAAEKAVSLARKFGIGWCSAKNISHAGAVGYYAEKVTRSGMIGIAMTASKPLMVYFGSRNEGVSTNPIAIAAPIQDRERPILLDMSTAAVALGKIMAARDAGEDIPEGWAVDERGAPTTDPAKVKSILPMAGPKGSGLSLMIEVLSSVLVANPIISASLTGRRDAPFNGLILAIDPKAFGDEGRFASGMEELAREIKKLPAAANSAPVMLPGERGAEELLRRTGDGIPLSKGTATRLVAAARDIKVTVPAWLERTAK